MSEELTLTKRDFYHLLFEVDEFHNEEEGRYDAPYGDPDPDPDEIECVCEESTSYREKHFGAQLYRDRCEDLVNRITKHFGPASR